MSFTTTPAITTPPNSNTTTTNIGGVPYFVENMPIYLPYVLFSCFGIFFGILGNGLIVGTILTVKELRRNSTCILILNLSFADLVISLFVDSFTVVGVFVGKMFFDERMPLCKLLGATCLISCGTSLVTMGMLALNRYITIFHQASYKKIFSIPLTIVFCFVTWFLGFLVTLPNLVGWGDLVYDVKTLNCIFDRLKKVFTATFSVTCIIIPCIAIAFCYFRVFWHASQVKRRVQTHSSKSVNHVLKSAMLARSLFASFFLFAICWIPVSIILLVDLDDYLPMSAHVFTNLPAHLNSALNPIFYGLFNPKMRNGYKRFLSSLICYSLPKTVDDTFEHNPKETASSHTNPFKKIFTHQSH